MCTYGHLKLNFKFVSIFLSTKMFFKKYLTHFRKILLWRNIGLDLTPQHHGHQKVFIISAYVPDSCYSLLAFLLFHSIFTKWRDRGKKKRCIEPIRVCVCLWSLSAQSVSAASQYFQAHTAPVSASSHRCAVYNPGQVFLSAFYIQCDNFVPKFSLRSVDSVWPRVRPPSSGIIWRYKSYI